MEIVRDKILILILIPVISESLIYKSGKLSYEVYIQIKELF